MIIGTENRNGGSVPKTAASNANTHLVKDNRLKAPGWSRAEPLDCDCDQASCCVRASAFGSGRRGRGRKEEEGCLLFRASSPPRDVMDRGGVQSSLFLNLNFLISPHLFTLFRAAQLHTDITNGDYNQRGRGGDGHEKSGAAAQFAGIFPPSLVVYAPNCGQHHGTWPLRPVIGRQFASSSSDCFFPS